nr:DegT/DnrJ/EryC1/StrS family aminotransferase [Vibrio sp. IB15]
MVKNVTRKINLFQPCLGKEEAAEVAKVFESNWIGKGPKTSQFEENFALHLDSTKEHVLSTTSCTEAIFLTSKIFDFGQNDEIIVPTNSFPSVASSILESGAKIVFCDIDSRSLNVELKHFEHLVTENTKAIFITHYGGYPTDMDDIMSFCSTHNIKVIEDSACAISSRYKGKRCGTFGDMAFWSFDAMKTLTTGDGAMIYFKDENDRTSASEWLYLGLPAKEKSGLDKSADDNSAGWWEFDITKPGRRAVMNDITAAIGLVQLDKVPSFISRRAEIDSLYREKLSTINDLLLPPKPDFDYESSFYFFWVQTEKRDELAKFLLANGVYCTFRYWPLHKVDLFSYDNMPEFSGSEKATATTLNLPIHQSMSNEDVEYICDLIHDFMSR